MATIDITRNMIPSRYGEADQWITASEFDRREREHHPWIELRMRCKYTRRVERFSVLYQGPGGSMRLEMYGPQVTGPIGSFIAQASVIASSPVARARYIDVEEGDVLVINGQRLVILDDQPHDYPRLVTEVEAGIAAALAVVRERMIRASGDPHGTEEANAMRTSLQGELTGLRRDIANLAGELRQRYAAPATR